MARLSLDELEQRVEAVEREMAEIDQQLSDPQVYADGDRVRALKQRRDALAAEQSPLEQEWARRAELA